LPQREKPARESSAVVLDPGVEGDGTPVSLVEAARAEKERRARSGRSSVVINDKNLARYARKGQLTVVDPKAKDQKKAAGIAKTAPAPALGVHDEQYWRGRALDIRQRWRQAADDAKKLEQKSTELRQKFYMENDIFLRDNQIKPEWDRVLDRLRQARLDADAAKQELEAFLDEGRAAGAMPGWLREGEDDEPQEAPNKKAPATKKRDGLPPAQSIEPPVIDDKGRGDRSDHGSRGHGDPSDPGDHGRVR
jgi:hypothetical protein